MSKLKVHYYSRYGGGGSGGPQCGVKSATAWTTNTPADVTCRRCYRFLDWVAPLKVTDWLAYIDKRKADA